MSRVTIASLQKTIDDLNNIIGVKSTEIINLDTRLKSAISTRDKYQNELSERAMELNRVRGIAEQMRGFIRAHHTEKRGTGQMEQRYNERGDWVQEPVFCDIYPFMEVEL